MRLYTIIARMFFNTFVVFIALNLLVLGLDLVKPGTLARPVREPETEVLPVRTVLPDWLVNFDDLRKAYPGRPDGQIIRLLDESWNIPLQCESGVLYRERSFRGLNFVVDDAGFRWIKDQAAWPPRGDAYN